ncbi:MAG: AAA family ATPase [Gemmataceae bacterium]|nr:AAA family ATPase [Gemmataceae bacterium]MCI0739792.1 AAA family ATPase [Gemmataceae bacterium]
MKNDGPVSVQCFKCGNTVMVPSGGKRLCSCGAWISADSSTAPSALAEQLGDKTKWPRIEGDLSAIERLNDGYRRITRELSKAIVGQQRVIEELLIAIFARGHCLLVGVPGLAKTLMIRTLADALNLSFSRIQFTPDLMPSDITGTEVLQEDKATGQRVFKFLHGPIFSNVILADEINRTPPKTQAALLEAMQERQVTVGGTRHKLPDPFFVLATQNPIEQEGTYPLPEAQQDRFMFNVVVDYPEEEEEFKIVEMTTAVHTPAIERILGANDILEMQDIVRKVPVAPYVIRYAMKFTRLTRKDKGDVPDFIREYVTWGAGPRATQNLVLGAKARAVLHGRYYVSCEDIRSVAHPVLRHRIITNFNAEAEGVKPDDIVRRLADIIPRDPNEEALARGKAPTTAAAG